jgi:hypothetical protein
MVVNKFKVSLWYLGKQFANRSLDLFAAFTSLGVVVCNTVLSQGSGHCALLNASLELRLFDVDSFVRVEDVAKLTGSVLKHILTEMIPNPMDVTRHLV